MGKNFDWFHSHGRLFVNRKNLKKSAVVYPKLKAAQWVAKYPSLTFNQIAEQAPMGGMNSEGLAGEVSIMFGGTEYPKTAAKEAINELQWIQYLLDTSANVKEAIVQARKVELVPVSSYTLHYHFCDRSGQCAVFEYRKGKLEVFEPGEKRNPFALTNTPFEWEHIVGEGAGNKPVIQNQKDAIDALNRTGGYRSAELTKMVGEFSTNQIKTATEEVARMWEMLDTVSLFPAWQIVYELESRKISFKVETNTRRVMSTVQTVALSEFREKGDLDCRFAQGKEGVKTHNNQFILPSLNYDLEKLKEERVKEKPVVLTRADFSSTEESEKILRLSRGMTNSIDEDLLKNIQDYARTSLSCEMKD